jgi:hypothetical protein
MPERLPSREESEQGSEGQNQTQCRVDDHLYHRQRLTGNQLETVFGGSRAGCASQWSSNLPITSKQPSVKHRGIASHGCPIHRARAMSRAPLCRRPE